MDSAPSARKPQTLQCCGATPVEQRHGRWAFALGPCRNGPLRTSAVTEAATRADLEASRADLLARRMASTAATYHKILKILYGWLAEEEEIPVNPMAK